MKRLTTLWAAVIAVCLLVLVAFASSCSTSRAPQDFEALAKTQPCAASWNLRYERLVGDSCYRKRLTQAAKAGCRADTKERDDVACKVARMLERSGAASRSLPDPLDLEQAISAGCDAGDGDGCALVGHRRLDAGHSVDKALALFRRGCMKGSAVSCFELHMLYANGEATLDQDDSSVLIADVRSQCEQGVVTACRLEETLTAGEAKSTGANKSGADTSAAETPDARGQVCGDDDTKCLQDACRRGRAPACTRFASLLEQAGDQALGRAFGAYERACAMGDWAGCGELGRFYEQGMVVPRDFSVARQLFEWACTPTNPSACVSAGRMFAKGLGGSREAAVAHTMFVDACDSGDAAGCRNAAGLVAPQDQERAEHLFSKACDLDDGPSCVRLAHLYLSDSTGREHTNVQSSQEQMQRDTRIAKLFDRACDAGYADGCKEGADRFVSGDGVTADQKVAAELAAKACASGSSSHCWGAADAYRFGFGVEADHPRAERLIESAIAGYREDCQKDKQGSRACMNAAHALAHGYPKKKRLDEARTFLTEACDDGAEDACREVAFQQVAGEIFAVDRERGIGTMTELCDKGDHFVCRRLAAEYSFGAQNEDEHSHAVRLHSQACYWRSESAGCAAYGTQILRSPGRHERLEEAYRHASRVCTEDEAVGCPAATQVMLRRSPDEVSSRGAAGEEDKALSDKLEKLCVYEGHDVACTPLARLYESGFGAKQDTYRALSLYERVCDDHQATHPEACSRARLVRLAHKLVDEQDSSAGERARAHEKACKGGDADACVMLARHQEFGSFDADRFETATTTYRRACELGNADACTVYVATGYEEGSLRGPKFRTELEWACEKGTAAMCSKWGRIMGSHRWDLAVRLNQHACQKGLVGACRFLQVNLEAREAVVEAKSSE